MQLTFNTLLREAEIPPAAVRLVRHKAKRPTNGRTAYELWRDSKPEFELYQAHQKTEHRSLLAAKYWATFLCTPNGKTLFAGLYQVDPPELVAEVAPWLQAVGADTATSWDLYKLTREEGFGEFEGRLMVGWEEGKPFERIQSADNGKAKPILELSAAFNEDAFPGFLNFQVPLSKIDALPSGWKAAITAARGVYLLTCPATFQHYVGSAAGAHGFLGRWRTYVSDGHGGNKALMERDPTDYLVSILEVAGTAAGEREIIEMEQRWMKKLRAKEVGLNR